MIQIIAFSIVSFAIGVVSGLCLVWHLVIKAAAKEDNAKELKKFAADKLGEARITLEKVTLERKQALLQCESLCQQISDIIRPTHPEVADRIVSNIVQNTSSVGTILT